MPLSLTGIPYSAAATASVRDHAARLDPCPANERTIFFILPPGV